MSEFPYRTLARPLPPAQRESIASFARATLRWQRTLDGWERPGRAPDATPFVSIYAGFRLRGCFGSDEGKPGERLARAFLLSLDDVRFGGIAPDERATLCAQISYFFDEKRADPSKLGGELEVGAQGVALIADDAPPVVLLPQVARDHALDVPGFLDTFARKVDPTLVQDESKPADGELFRAASASWKKGRLFSFRTDDVIVRAHDRPENEGDSTPTPEALAAAWLARLVADDGSITFAIDPRARTRRAIGEMHHGRAAVVVRALSTHGGFERVVKRARTRLARDVATSLSGEKVAGWPDDPAVVAATLAFASMAGVDVKRDLLAYLDAHREAVCRVPWHSAQIAAALGKEAPDAIYASCVEALSTQPWSPWTMMAARARDDAATMGRCTPPLLESIRSKPPFEGGSTLTPVPELALTALVVEALAKVETLRVRRIVGRARAFLRRWQNVGDAMSPSIDAELATGAFPLTPIEPRLRADVTAHALLALHESLPEVAE